MAVSGIAAAAVAEEEVYAMEAATAHACWPGHGARSDAWDPAHPVAPAGGSGHVGNKRERLDSS